MKKMIIGFLAVASIVMYSCNDSAEPAHKDEQAAAPQPAKDSATENVKVVKATFSNVDAGAVTYIKKLTNDYLSLKNALANEKAGEAADASKNMYEAMKGFDKSLLTAEQ